LGDLPFHCLTGRSEAFFTARNQNGTRGVGASSREQFGVNATFKTALAMSIVIAGAILIYETFHQDLWWYGSGLAMAWGATVSWVRNLI
jgi:hypothetical protein